MADLPAEEPPVPDGAVPSPPPATPAPPAYGDGPPPASGPPPPGYGDGPPPASGPPPPGYGYGTPPGYGYGTPPAGQGPPPGPPPGYGYGTPPGYGGPPPGAAPGTYGYGVAWGPTGPRTEPMAVASLVTSAVCALASFMCCLGLVGSIAGIVLGVVARSRIKASQGQLTGDGLAIAGIVVGIAGVGLYVLVFALMASGSFFTTLR